MFGYISVKKLLNNFWNVTWYSHWKAIIWSDLAWAASSSSGACRYSATYASARQSSAFSIFRFVRFRCDSWKPINHNVIFWGELPLAGFVGQLEPFAFEPTWSISDSKSDSGIIRAASELIDTVHPDWGWCLAEGLRQNITGCYGSLLQLCLRSAENFINVHMYISRGGSGDRAFRY